VPVAHPLGPVSATTSGGERTSLRTVSYPEVQPLLPAIGFSLNRGFRLRRNATLLWFSRPPELQGAWV